MQEKILKTLEFDKIKQLLIEHASSTLGERRIKELKPSSSFTEVVTMQEETDEAAQVLRLKGNVPLSGIYDIRPHIKRAAIGGILNPIELMQIASTMYVGRTMKRFIEGLIDEEMDLPILAEKAEQIAVLTSLEHQIKNAIDDNGDVLDSASETLRHIRQGLRANERRIREKLEGLIRSRNAAKMLSDAIITIRNDRYVIPVKQEYRSNYGGIVHDQSSSGQTLFIEPQSIVDLNNQLREWHMKEQQEIERILSELSSAVAEVVDDLTIMLERLADLDFIFAKALYGRAMKGSKPTMNQNGIIRLFKARHPLLPIDKVVANDISLGKDYTSIVITGPNTGGKTITLKTIGLCTLMAQAGLQIPALDGSELAVFTDVFADIGDEQSIEQSLSTFSSHMVNIVEILKHVNHESLVLFDELGAGTDPQEGAALAISILDEVYQRGARVVATTHYPELKAYGYNREGVVNASVEFDVETLKPTYRLLIGVPGRSNAFEISRRLGLANNIIEHAKSYVGADTNQVENMIAALEKAKREAEKEQQEARELVKEAEKMHRDIQKRMMEFYEHRDQLYAKAEEKAAKVVDAAKEKADEIIRDLRNMQMNTRANVKEHELIDAKKRLEEAAPHLDKTRKQLASQKRQHTFTAGDEVKVISFNQKGTLLEKVGDHEWQVQMGIMKMKVKESDLEFVQSQQKVVTKPLATVKGKDYHVSLELDLRGERYEDALSKVEKYIDDALLAGYPRVSIIHGKGTGALRSGVQEYLKHHRSVKRIRLGDAGEGGSGVTIVEFK
ncbi:endonuclease MutS2 [Heyndrickxia ginsengihumi]|uniref:Endonuclease MutS2 n=1 Tax=Heyndrickxia ginsengihumi TaxID=363870 RepID=A0A0A6VH91_9BACI|nr:endonuclease MutS2 [Heyndrickxia ginsengihumi]KHD86951.1 recombination and DNA strand exchange inhibitor protein [Heyndrickxia ginsengihumi]MBE6182718.1 endonuclease MutS2 [Bacillus sp. (in: firmicutes)]MCM3021969.1 endonuclease MutS2 [Heyndrickxia ginsengihumi]NEY20884.1 endonuclease MutS2 [Heyndrickxia ginsengihumi]